MGLLETALSCNFTGSGAAAVTNNLTRRNSEILRDFNKCLKSMIHFNYFSKLKQMPKLCSDNLRRLEPFGTKSLDVGNTFFRHYLVNT